MKKTNKPPAFANQDEEDTWWASRQGREFFEAEIVGTSNQSGKARAASLKGYSHMTNPVRRACAPFSSAC